MTVTVLHCVELCVYILIRGVMFNVVVIWVRDGLKITLLGGLQKIKAR